MTLGNVTCNEVRRAAEQELFDLANRARSAEDVGGEGSTDAQAMSTSKWEGSISKKNMGLIKSRNLVELYDSHLLVYPKMCHNTDLSGIASRLGLVDKN